MRASLASLIVVGALSTSALARAQAIEPPAAAPPAAAPPAAAPPAAAPPAPALAVGSSAATAPAAPADVKLEMVAGEVKMLALDDAKAWSVLPEGGLGARAVDDGHTLRLVAQNDGLFTIRIERNDATVLRYEIRVGKEPVVVGPKASEAGERAGDADAQYYRNTIDLNLEGGAGRHFGDPATTLGFVRARAGVMFARWPTFLMIGATYELSNLSPATFGVQAELLNLAGGVWGQAGGLLDIHGKAGGMAALGFSVIGVEGQYRGYEDTSYGFALLGKVRIPIGVILYALDVNKKKQK